MSALMDGLAFVANDSTVQTMTAIFSTLLLVTAGSGQLCTKTPKEEHHHWLPDRTTHTYKRRYEIWALGYGVFWMSCMAAIVVFEWYLFFTRWHYALVLGGLAAPLVLQPFLFPCITGDQHVPLGERYCLKANVWIALFTFVGNYWYTHYFYNVLGASYTMPAHDVNGVPISMFFATHFYFTFYHVFANVFLRKVTTTYEPSFARHVYFALTVLSLSYFTAFMESLTISGFPCYDFQDRFLAYTLGSAFYGIYFIVSYPMFLRLDTDETFTVFRAATESLATGMVVLCLLDFVRLGLGVDEFTFAPRPCKTDGSLSCAPFNGTPC